MFKGDPPLAARSSPRTCCPESLAQSRLRPRGRVGHRGQPVPVRPAATSPPGETTGAGEGRQPCPHASLVWGLVSSAVVAAGAPRTHTESAGWPVAATGSRAGGRQLSHPPRRSHVHSVFHTRPWELALLRSVCSGHWPLSALTLSGPRAPGATWDARKTGASRCPAPAQRLRVVPPPMLFPDEDGLHAPQASTVPPTVSQARKGHGLESRSEALGFISFIEARTGARRPAGTHRGSPSGPETPPAWVPAGLSGEEGLPQASCYSLTSLTQGQVQGNQMPQLLSLFLFLSHTHSHTKAQTRMHACTHMHKHTCTRAHTWGLCVGVGSVGGPPRSSPGARWVLGGSSQISGRGGNRRCSSADSGGPGSRPPAERRSRWPVMGVLPDTVRPGPSV